MSTDFPSSYRRMVSGTFGVGQVIGSDHWMVRSRLWVLCNIYISYGGLCRLVAGGWLGGAITISGFGQCLDLTRSIHSTSKGLILQGVVHTTLYLQKKVWPFQPSPLRVVVRAST